MAQYYKGRKIGTCESMYYMRLEEAQQLARMGAKDDDDIKFKEYLQDNATMFRFPFPDEDDGIPENCEFDRGIKIPAGGIEVGHSEIVMWNENNKGGNGMNIFLPCPHSNAFKNKDIELSMGGTGEQYLYIRFQAIRDGKEKTLFSCARCGQLQRFDDDDIIKIKERTKEFFAVPENTATEEKKKEYNEMLKIIDRIK